MVTWTNAPLCKIADVKTGPFGSSLHASDYVTSGTPIITVEHLGERSITRQNLPLVSEADRQRLSSYSLQTGDIVFSRVGSVDRNAYVTETENGWLFSGRLLRIRVTQAVINAKYLSYYFKFETTAQRIRDIAVGQTMASLNTKLLNSFIVEYPLLPEQRAIAVALSDVDTYIAALEKLIAKKRAVKQGAMQELLTGKRRLAGFEGEWVNMNLVANSTLKARIGWQGLTTAEYFDYGYSYLITGTDFSNGKIAWDTCHYVDKQRYEQDPNIQVVNDDVLITKDGTIGKVAIVSGLSKKATLNSGVFVLRSRAGAYDHRYVYYVLLSQIFIDFLDKLSAGSTINHLYQKDFVNFEVDVPPTVAEQIAIAEILSDMDAEIEVLTAKLNKLRNIKQGMMSELLTGHIRLTEQEEEAALAAGATPKVVELPKPKPKVAAAQTGGHNQQFDDAVMIACIVNVLYSNKFPLGRKKVQKCLYLLRRHQDESTAAFKKKAAGPYGDEVRYKGGEPIARSNRYIATKTDKSKGTTFAKGDSINQALSYIQNWGKQADIKWVADKLKFKKVDELELLATVDMAICDLTEAGTPVSVATIKHLIATNEEWKAKLKKQTFSDANIAHAIRELQTLF